MEVGIQYVQDTFQWYRRHLAKWNAELLVDKENEQFLFLITRKMLEKFNAK